MTGTQIRGTTQILDGSIPASKFASSLNLPTAQLAEGALFLKKDGSVTLTNSLNMGGNTITNVGAGLNGTDAVNKAQLDAVANGFGMKGGADTVATANISALSGLQTINGVTLTDGDVVFLYAQTDGKQNGPWVAHSGTWTRPAWYTGTLAAEGALIVIERGTYAGYYYILTTQGTITVESTSTTWQVMPTASAPTPGNGISVSGSQISVRNGNGVTFDGSQNLTLQLYGSSLNLSASGLKISDAGSPGQVMIGGAGNAATFATLSGDVNTVSAAGVVALIPTVRRSSSFVYNEPPTGAINGTNTSFSLTSTPVTGTVAVYLNGVRQYPGAGNDYTIASGTITMLTAPQAGERVTVDYQV